MTNDETAKFKATFAEVRALWDAAFENDQISDEQYWRGEALFASIDDWLAKRGQH